MRLTAPLVSVWVVVASAQDPQLEALHATLVTLHAHAAEATIENSGARPELTLAKHQLRDWIETQLGSLKDLALADTLAVQINKALASVSASNSADDQNLLGALGEVRLSHESGLLIVTTGIGIICQYDESAYAYKRVNGRWQRIWESEQNDYSPNKYAPQYIFAVHVLQPIRHWHQEGAPLVLTLGNHWGCASSWQRVYYRVWRLDPAGSKLLIDDSEVAFLRADNYAEGSIAQDRTMENPPVDVLIEFTERSIDAGVHNREGVHHYLIAGDQVRRVDPVALGPRDFVDEWLTRPWNESAAWSASQALQSWHQRLHADWVGGEFTYPTMHCQAPDLWQVGFVPNNLEKNIAAEPAVYFLVRWRPPYHFTMAEISGQPWANCTQEDRDADEWRTLFSTQEWRQ